MNWIDQANPPETGRYLVSVNLNNHVFNYVAHYDSDQHCYYKWDPFAGNNQPLVLLPGKVNAWANEVGVFMAF